LVADVALFADGQVLLVRYRDVRRYDGQRGWFVPDDYLTHLEPPADAARRIAREQAGIELDSGQLKLVDVESFGNAAWHLVFHFAVELDALPALVPGENLADQRWFSHAEMPAAEETAHEGWTLEIVERARLAPASAPPRR
jgi:ADP-ribose pyrophosphatase YjhB (NUDIX family)